MVNLFPKLRNRMWLSAALYVGLVFVMARLRPDMGHALLTIIILAGLAIIFAAQYVTAANAHAQLLNRLYNQLDVTGFLREYEPMLGLRLRSPNLYLMVRLHLSNAYCAQGRFDDAIRLLTSIDVSKGKPEDALLSKFAVTSNLCYCAQQKNDVASAQAYLDQLLDLRRQLEALQLSKPEKKRMVFNTELNEQCMAFLTSGRADVEALKKQVRQSSTQQLHRVTTSLWIARAELAANNRREAENILTQIVKVAPDLYPGQVAQQLLSELPARPEDKDAEKHRA